MKLTVSESIATLRGQNFLGFQPKVTAVEMQSPEIRLPDAMP
jgi:hypothetical protein